MYTVCPSKKTVTVKLTRQLGYYVSCPYSDTLQIAREKHRQDKMNLTRQSVGVSRFGLAVRR